MAILFDKSALLLRTFLKPIIQIDICRHLCKGDKGHSMASQTACMLSCLSCVISIRRQILFADVIGFEAHSKKYMQTVHNCYIASLSGVFQVWYAYHVF